MTTKKFSVTIRCEQQTANFTFGDKDSIEAELERLRERRDNLHSQGRQTEADDVHELWCHITTHFDFLRGAYTSSSE